MCRMSAGILITPTVNNPYFAFAFVNKLPCRLAVWLRINEKWWATPNIALGARKGFIPALEGATVEWRVLYEGLLAVQNLLNGTAWTIQDAEVMEDKDNVSWQGQFIVPYGMLGRTIQLQLF